MPAPVHQSSSTVTAALQINSFTIPVPSGVVAGDIVQLFILREDSATETAPSSTGFTLKATADNGTTDHLHVLWKRATGADSGSYTVALAANNNWTDAIACRTSGCIATGDPYDVNTSGVNTAAAAPTLSVTTTVADTLLYYAAKAYEGGTWTAPSGMTGQQTSTGTGMYVATQTQAAAGSSGSKAAAFTGGSGRNAAHLLALKPPTSAAGAPPGAFLFFF